MKHHKYFNTIWTDRDQEFYWDGLKTGAIISAIMVPCIVVNGITFVKYVKNTLEEFKNKKGG